jgi:xanthine dehydrogenase iron-sulfur cluster and FAD-binding subunit A
MTDTHTLRELMAGNLCRCTGYDGIIDGLEAWLHSGTSVTGEPERAS